jgi:hypothetical protein
VDDATATVLRHAHATLASTSGALLLERLLTGTGNLTAAKSRLGALTSSCQLGHNNLVD